MAVSKERGRNWRERERERCAASLLSPSRSLKGALCIRVDGIGAVMGAAGGVGRVGGKWGIIFGNGG